MNIIELAKQSGTVYREFEDEFANANTDGVDLKTLQTFAALVEAAARADEREECAKLVEPSEEHRRDALWGYIGGTEGVELLDGRAAAIRERGTT